MSKEYIIEVLLLCASHVEYVNRDTDIVSPATDLLASVEKTLTLLAKAIENSKEEIE